MREFSLPEHQAAGHDGCLTLEDGSLFVKLTTPQEIRFYNDIETFDNTKKDDGLGSKLTDWMPVYLGTLTEGEIDHSSPKDADKEYIVLSNLYHKFIHPSVLDIKLGAKLTDDLTTTPEKIARLEKVSKSTTSGSLGFRICGMKSFVDLQTMPPELFDGMNSIAVASSGPYLEFNKQYGRNLDAKNVKDAILYFFTAYFSQFPHGKRHTIHLLQTFLKRLQLLYNCLLDYEIRIFSGSLLFLFENDMSRWPQHFEDADPLIPTTVLDSDDEEEAEEEEAPLSKLNLIDFGHAKFVEGQGPDDNVLTGLENLMEIFDELVNTFNT